MKLALGTVQFGLPYGVAGRGAVVPEREVRAILARASQLGIRMLDTAATYGDIEERLAAILPEGEWQVVTKLPPVPEALAAGDRHRWVHGQLARARDRLGEHLHGVLFHRADDLMGESAGELWDVCASWAASTTCRVGVSCYQPETLARIAVRFPISIAQVAGNALDQRLLQCPGGMSGHAELHVRSAFLQGLLLMDEAVAGERVPSARQALRRWHLWRMERGLSPLEAALGIVKALPGVSHCVVGVDALDQLEEIAEVWNSCRAMSATELASNDISVIDPRCWPVRKDP